MMHWPNLRGLLHRRSVQTETANPGEPRVLILTPVKDAAQ